MKTTLFTFESGAGTFWIRPEPAGRVQLGLDRSKLRTYSSATAAARAVAERSTGFAAWDESSEPAPSSLRKWKRPHADAARRSSR